MPKNILIINEYAGTPYHGMEFRHYYLSKELIKQGYDITIISASYSHLFKSIPSTKGEYTLEKIDGINYLWIKVPKYKFSASKKRVLKWFIYTFKLFRLPFNLLQNPDYIIVSPMETMPVYPAYRLAKKFNAKLIFEVKDIWPLSIVELGNFSSNNFFIKFLKYFEKFAIKNSDLIISVLPNYGEYLKDNGFDKDFAYIPNGIDLDEMKKTESLDENILMEIPKDKFSLKIVSKVFTLYEKYACRKFDAIITATPSIRDKFLKFNNNTIDINNYPLLEEFTQINDHNHKKNNEICYIGGISKIRSIEQIMEALKYLSDIKLNLAGNFESEELKKLIMSHPEWKKVNYQGFVDRNKVAEIMKNSKIGLVLFLPLPNHTESEPNKMFEYMASGLPVIASNFPLWNEIIEENNCGICVDPQSPEEIAKAVEYLINNPEIAKQMGENGRKVVEEKYNWEKEGKKLLEVYSIIVNKLN